MGTQKNTGEFSFDAVHKLLDQPTRAQRAHWQNGYSPQRQELPKTLVFAKNDNHAEPIVGILREEFGRGNEFAQKITYRTTGSKPEERIKAFRTSYYPRIAVTVDMIATGTDIEPVEIVVFMRSVKSRSLFEQMKGKGLRVIKDHDRRGRMGAWPPSSQALANMANQSVN